jgi:fibronectin-binding autotransporter adhesin
MPSRVLLRSYVVVLAMSAVCLPSARGDSFNWIGLGNTPNWDDKPGGLYDNWGTIALPSSTSDVLFGNFLSSGNPNLHGNRTVNSVTVSTGGDFTLTGGVGDTLTLASGNFTQQSGAASAGTNQVNVPVVMQTDGVWNIAGAGINFSGGVNPSFAAGIHMLTKTGAGPLTLSGGDALVSLLDVKAGSFTLNGATLRLYGSGPGNTGSATVGDGSAAASVLVENGAFLSTVGLVGMDIGGVSNNPASITLAGANTSWQGSGNVNFGLGGPGQLSIKDTAMASLGVLSLGNGTSGVLTVQSGAKLSDEVAILGASSLGAATVTGAGSQWTTSSNLLIGGDNFSTTGNGTLNVTNGGVLTASSINVFSGGNVTVDQGQISTAYLDSTGSGGTINLVTDPFSGPALTVSNPGASSTYGGVISGAGTLYKSGGSTLTLTGQNTLTGKTVIAGGQVILGNAEALQSSVVDFETKNGLNLNGLITAFLGSITGGSDQDFGSTSIYLDGSATDQTYSGNMTGLGTLTKLGTKRLILTGTKNFMAFTELDQGALQVNGKLQGVGVTVNSGGTLAGTGQVAANILVNSGGAVAPGTGAGSGDSAGILGVQSAFFENGSELDITLHGTTRGTKYGALVATNDVILGGKLRVTMFGFMPAAGQTFDIMDWGSVSGTFSGLVLPTLSSNLMWDKSKLYTDGALSIAIAGDYNGNGVVDAADYILWHKTLGATGAALAADGNNNGMVDAGDFDVWRSNFGRQAGGAATASVASVPEPSTGILLSVGLLLLLCLHVQSMHGRRNRAGRETA